MRLSGFLDILKIWRLIYIKKNFSLNKDFIIVLLSIPLFLAIIEATSSKIRILAAEIQKIIEVLFISY